MLPLPADAPRAVDAPGAPDVSRVTWLLAQLQDQASNKPANNKVVSIRTFEDWFLKKKPLVTEANAQLLYLGFELQGGLLEEVGAFEHSEVSSIASLGLLCKLLSYESCHDARLFRAVLRRLDLSVLSQMRLQHHVHRNRGLNNRLDAFRVLESLELAPDKLATLLQDDFAFHEFKRWQGDLQSWLCFRTLHRPSTSRLRTVNTELSARPALRTHEYRRIAQNAFATLHMCLTTFEMPDADAARAPDGDKGGAHAASQLKRVESLYSLATVAVETAAEAGPVAAPQPSTVQWFDVPCPTSTWRERYGMRAAYQPVPFDQQPDACVMRAMMRLPFPPLSVVCLLADHAQFIRGALQLKHHLPQDVKDRLRQLMDGQIVPQLHGASVVEQLQLGTLHEVYSELLECNLGTPSAPHVTLRLWLLKSLRVIPATGGAGEGSSEEQAPPSYLFLCTAVPPVAASSPQEDAGGASPVHAGEAADTGCLEFGSSPSSPTSSAGRTAPPKLLNLKPSGVLICPASCGGADVDLCALLGRDSVKLISGDLLGERLLFWRTLENMLFVLEHLCPLPADFIHSFFTSHQERCLARSTASSFCSTKSQQSHQSLEVEMVEERC